MNDSVRHINPTSFYSEKELDILAFVLAARIEKIIVDDKPMSAKQAMNWLKWGHDKFFRYVNKGIIKGHKSQENEDPVYFKSEIIEAIKGV